MNERIRELYKQAVVDAGFDYLPTPTLERFAELIVRECMKVSRGADGLDATHEAWYLIKEHFGVEE